MLNFLLSISHLLANNITKTAEKAQAILGGIVGPCLTVLGSMGVIYIIVLAVQYAKSENDSKRADAKKRIVNLAIGLVVIIILITMCMAISWDKVIVELFGNGYWAGNEYNA